MSEWAVVSLGTDWSPAQLLSPRSPWGAVPSLRLGDVASIRTTLGPLDGPMPLITPGAVDVAHGTAIPSRVADDDGMVLGHDLEVGDVLVPSHGSGPCILISDAARGVAFRSFLVVRCLSGRVDPVVAWAALSSLTGVRTRGDLSAGASVRTLTAAALAGFPIPTAACEHVEAFRTLVPRPLLVESEGDELRSVWALRDLRGASSWAGASSVEEVAGTPLSELGTLWSGTIDRAEWFAVEANGRLPVLTHRVVRGQRDTFRPWATGRRTTTAATVVFTRTEPFRAMRAPAGALLSKELLALDVGPVDRGSVDDPVSAPMRDADALASYFSTRKGRGRLEAAAHGAVLRHLSILLLRSVRVEGSDLERPQPSSQAAPLAERLEAAMHRALAS